MHAKSIIAFAAATMLVLSGCSQVSDQLDEAQAPDASSAVLEAPFLVTRQWSVNDDMLSVVVENTTDRTLTYAEGVITARSADNELLALSLDEGGRGCCEVINLPPGQQFGFYLDVSGDARRISRVEVSYRNISWGPARPAAQTAALSSRPLRLESVGSDSVVLADLTSSTSLDEVIAQAFLSTSGGEFLAVVSGRWTCLEPGTRRIRMQLFHPVPDGTVVDRILVHPVSDDPTRSAPACGGDQRR